jgi:putative RNA 2'-phosphotransferase
VDSSRLVKLSKLLSLMLRHEPANFGLVLDAEGFASVEDTLRAVRSRVPEATEADMVAVVESIEPDKRRFSIVERDIRANYGHSLDARIRHTPVTPPAVLLHGTNAGALELILRSGLEPMKRQYVHLTTNEELAGRVGARRGKPVLVRVDAAAACAAGIEFYRANESFWLADRVPARFLSPEPESPRAK